MIWIMVKPNIMLGTSTFKEPSSPYGVVSDCEAESSSISFLKDNGYSGTGISIIRLDSMSYHDTFPTWNKKKNWNNILTVKTRNQTANYNQEEFYSEGGNLRCPG